MRIAGACFVFALAAGAALAQSKSEPKPKSDSITLTGCVVRSETSPAQYTVKDKKVGATYRLTGVDFRDYINRPVIIIGTGAKKLAIVGGLTPTPNAGPARTRRRSKMMTGYSGETDVFPQSSQRR